MNEADNPPRLTGCRRKLSKGFVLPQRYILAIMGFFGVINAYTTRTCLSVAINKIVNITNVRNRIHPETCPEKQAPAVLQSITYHWSSEQKNWSLASFFYGYFVSHIPGGILAEYYGGRHVFGGSILVTIVVTMLTPISVKLGEWKGLIVMRVIMGIGQGVMFPALNILLAQWIPLQERSRLGSLSFAAVEFGVVIGNGVSGWLIKMTKMWNSVFYFFGAFAVLWYILWLLLCFSFPATHPYIKDEEYYFLMNNLDFGKPKRSLKEIPWAGIFTNVPVWALIIAELGHDFSHYILAIFLPVYFSDVLKISIEKNGIYSAAPYVVRFLMAMIFGAVGDHLIVTEKLSVTKVRKLYTAFTTFLVLASYNNCDEQYALIMFSIGLGFMGFYYPGLRVNAMDLSPNFAGTLMAIVNGSGILAGVVGFVYVAYITQNQILNEWKIIFWTGFATRIVSGLIYLYWGSAVRQEFDREDYVFAGCCKMDHVRSGGEKPNLRMGDAK